MGVSTDFSWAGLRCHSGMSLSFLYSMPRSTSQVSWWRHENLHPLIRDRQHQTADTSQGEGTAPRHPLQKKCPGRRTQEHTEKAMWSLGGLGEAEGLGGALSLRGQGDSGPPGAPPAAVVPLPKAEPAKPVIWQQFTYWWCLLPFSLLLYRKER